jgi:Glyoxalase/Bleomycin resistance protein/Dioxygenase superfamily
MNTTRGSQRPHSAATASTSAHDGPGSPAGFASDPYDGYVQVSRIGQIRINVRELDRAVAFYRDVLGMEFLFDVPEQGLAFFNCGGVRLYLAAADPDSPKTTAAIYYTVDSLEDGTEPSRTVAWSSPTNRTRSTPRMKLRAGWRSSRTAKATRSR